MLNSPVLWGKSFLLILEFKTCEHAVVKVTVPKKAFHI